MMPCGKTVNISFSLARQIVGCDTYDHYLTILVPYRHYDPFDDQGPVFLTWLNFNPSIKVLDEIAYTFPNFNGCTVEVGEWISNLISHIIME